MGYDLMKTIEKKAIRQLKVLERRAREFVHNIHERNGDHAIPSDTTSVTKQSSSDDATTYSNRKDCSERLVIYFMYLDNGFEMSRDIS